MPNQPSEDDAGKTLAIAGEDARAYLDSSDALSGPAQAVRPGIRDLWTRSYEAIDAALTSGAVSEDGGGLEAALAESKAEVIALPALINASRPASSQPGTRPSGSTRVGR